MAIIDYVTKHNNNKMFWYCCIEEILYDQKNIENKTFISELENMLHICRVHTRATWDAVRIAIISIIELNLSIVYVRMDFLSQVVFYITNSA